MDSSQTESPVLGAEVLDDRNPATVVVKDLLARSDNDIAAALWLAAVAIVGLSSAASYGLTYTVPYDKVLPPKPRPPSL